MPSKMSDPCTYVWYWTEQMLSQMAALGRRFQCGETYGNNRFEEHMLHAVIGESPLEFRAESMDMFRVNNVASC